MLKNKREPWLNEVLFKQKTGKKSKYVGWGIKKPPKLE